MKKEDLKNGMVVETKESKRYLVLNTDLVRVDGREPLKKYGTDLTHKDCNKFDIVKIYKVKPFYTLIDIFNDYALELLWQRPVIKLTEDEKIILRNVSREFKYITRDKNNSISIFTEKPLKSLDEWLIGWDGNFEYMDEFNHLFSFVQWTDDEPFNFREHLNNLDKGGDK